MDVKLHKIAHARAGDKGNRLNVSLIPYAPSAWAPLQQQVTENAVLQLFRHRGASTVKRYELPMLRAFNFVIDDVLEGGVNRSLNVDVHGKTNSFLLLTLDIDIPDSVINDAQLSYGIYNRG